MHFYKFSSKSTEFVFFLLPSFYKDCAADSHKVANCFRLAVCVQIQMKWKSILTDIRKNTHGSSISSNHLRKY